MKALLFTGGENPDLKKASGFFRGYSFIAAADSGLSTVEDLGLSPDLVIGDMDSLPGEIILDGYPGSEIIRLDTAKDSSDTEAALRLLKERGFREIVLVGGGGGRMDHLFAIERLFAGNCRPSLWIAGESVTVYLSSPEAERLEAGGLEPGDTVSVFPLGKGPHRIKAANLRWQLDIPWDEGAYSLSNWAEAENVCFSGVSGAFMCVFPLKESLSVRIFPEPGNL